jgi:hypothetical protein
MTRAEMVEMYDEEFVAEFEKEFAIEDDIEIPSKLERLRFFTLKTLSTRAFLYIVGIIDGVAITILVQHFLKR